MRWSIAFSHVSIILHQCTFIMKFSLFFLLLSSKLNLDLVKIISKPETDALIPSLSKPLFRTHFVEDDELEDDVGDIEKFGDEEEENEVVRGSVGRVVEFHGRNVKYSKPTLVFFIEMSCFLVVYFKLIYSSSRNNTRGNRKCFECIERVLSLIITLQLTLSLIQIAKIIISF